eukprot:11771421-Ditylum_brightwellii.AAC.1
MEWCESLPHFCTSSETLYGILHHLVDIKQDLPSHNFEHCMLLKHANPQEPPAEEEVASLLEVFVDDSIDGTNNLTTEDLHIIS